MVTESRFQFLVGANQWVEVSTKMWVSHPHLQGQWKDNNIAGAKEQGDKGQKDFQ